MEIMASSAIARRKLAAKNGKHENYRRGRISKEKRRIIVASISTYR